LHLLFVSCRVYRQGTTTDSSPILGPLVCLDVCCQVYAHNSLILP
jgi:hypothetical protein